MKGIRHGKIKEIIEHSKIETQEDLAAALRHDGIEVTQATVSRDIKELMLIKMFRMPKAIIIMLFLKNIICC